MRRINSLSDAQIVINDLLDWKSKLESQNQDLHGLRLTNAGAAVDDSDYVIKSQIPSIPDIPGQNNQDYTIVFSIAGTPGVSDVFPEYVVGKDRVGYVTAVWLRAKVSPVAGPFTVQLFKNGVNLLVTDPSITTSGPTFFSNFITPVPNFGKGDFIGGTVTAVNNCGNVSVGVCVRRVL